MPTRVYNIIRMVLWVVQVNVYVFILTGCRCGRRATLNYTVNVIYLKY